MKIIEGLKKIKELQRKADDLKAKVSEHCAQYDYEKSVYPDQRGQVASWVQAYSDIMDEVLKLRIAIQRTNLSTSVTITLGEKEVTKTIAEWVHRRRDLASREMEIWSAQTDRGLKDHLQPQSVGNPVKVAVVRYYEPLTRDKKVSMFREEPHVIDATLEVINAVTDLV